jgi:hypothetical protein
MKIPKGTTDVQPAEARDATATAGGPGRAELPAGACPRAVPDHGPVDPDCPIDCLRPVLHLQTLNPLARAYDAPFDPPRTVGDVIGLYGAGQLREIRGLGQRRILEIGAALVLAGLDIAQERPPQEAREHRAAGERP